MYTSVHSNLGVPESWRPSSHEILMTWKCLLWNPLSPHTQHTHNWRRTSRLSHSKSSSLPGNSSCPRNLTLFNRFQTSSWRTSRLWSWVEAESKLIVEMQALVPGLRQKSKKSTQLRIVQPVILSMDSLCNSTRALNTHSFASSAVFDAQTVFTTDCRHFQHQRVANGPVF